VGGKKEGYSFLLSFFFPFSLYGGLTRIFSQENIIKKSMLFFERTKHGKVSPQKKIISKFYEQYLHMACLLWLKFSTLNQSSKHDLKK
jgi:hypothetical protein